MKTTTKSPEQAQAEAISTFALLTRTLKVPEFIGLDEDAQLATLKEADNLLGGRLLCETSHRSLWAFVEMLARCHQVKPEPRQEAQRIIGMWTPL